MICISRINVEIHKEFYVQKTNANLLLSSHDRITLREICPENESDIILYTENNPDKIAKEFMLCTH